MIYLDNAATTQIDPSVLDAMVQFERAGRGNPYRGLHRFAERATLAIEKSREIVATFIGARSDEIIFTKSATEGLNVAIWNMVRGFGPGDEVVHTIFDHHATLLPLFELSKLQGFSIRTIGAERIIDDARRLIGERTKLVIAPHVSNVTGTILPIRELAHLAQSVGAKILIDGAQAVAHMPVDVRSLTCDAYAFSAHKMYGPMGIGALFVDSEVMKSWKPVLFGGGMVEEVRAVGRGSQTRVYGEIEARYLAGPRLFEAGTPNVTGIIGFARACELLDEIGRDKIEVQEHEIGRYLFEQLSRLSSIRVFGDSTSSIVSFTVEGQHPHDVAQYLADNDIAVRAGNHCAAPYSQSLNESGTVRVSLLKDTTREEIDQLITALKQLVSG